MTEIIRATIAALLPAVAAGPGKPGGLFDPELALTLATWITFVVFLGVIARFGWGPITRALDERERRMREDAERAETARRESEILLEEHRRSLDGAGEELERLIVAGKKRGEEIAERIRRDAQTSAEALTARARKEIEAERVKALAEVRAVAVEAAVLLSEKILEVEIDPARHEKLIEKTLEKLPKH